MIRVWGMVLATLGVFQALPGSGCSSIVTPRVPAQANEVINTIQDLPNDLCFSCRIIDSLCYNDSHLFDLTVPFGNERVKKMQIMSSNNVLYYSFVPVVEDREYSKVAYVSLDEPTWSGVIDNGSTEKLNFDSLDINQYQNRVYLGSVDGIWYYETGLPSPKRFAAIGDFITNIASKDYAFYLYFTKKRKSGIIKYLGLGEGGKYEFYLENKTIEEFVLARDAGFTIVYLDGTGLYAFNSKKQKDPVRLSRERFFRGLTVDAKGTVYAWHVDGIYKVNIDDVFTNSKLTRITDLAPQAMAFDRSNNIIYSTGKQLHKLAKVDYINCLAY